MATEKRQILINRGTETPATLVEGELFFNTQENILYVGDSNSAPFEVAKQTISDIFGLSGQAAIPAANDYLVFNGTSWELVTKPAALSEFTNDITFTHDKITDFDTATNALIEANNNLSHTQITDFNVEVNALVENNENLQASQITDFNTQVDARVGIDRISGSSTNFLAKDGTYQPITSAGNVTQETVESAITVDGVDGGKVLVNDGDRTISWAEFPQYEWQYVTTVVDNVVNLEVNADDLIFDFDTYDYKIVTTVETDSIDSSVPVITLDNNQSNYYNYIVTYHNSGVNATQTVQDANNFSFITNLGSASDSVTITKANIEMIISKAHLTHTEVITTYYTYMVDAKASIVGTSDETTGFDLFPVMSQLTGTFKTPDDNIESVEIKHAINAGTNDIGRARVYRRAK
jgi:hypothetical protein